MPKMTMDPDDPPPRHVALDLSIRTLLPGRVVRVLAIGVDEYALRVRYETIPAFDPRDSNDPDWQERNDWYLTGRDNHDNLYESGGGARGPSMDGSRTEGVYSLLGLPAADVSWLDIAFHAFGDPESFERPRYVLRVNMPLNVVVIEPPTNWP